MHPSFTFPRFPILLLVGLRRTILPYSPPAFTFFQRSRLSGTLGMSSNSPQYHLSFFPRFILPVGPQTNTTHSTGSDLPRLQRQQSGRHPAGPQSGSRMGPVQHPRQHHFPGLHRHPDGRESVRPVPRAPRPVAQGEHAGPPIPPGGVPRCSGLPAQRCEQLHDW